MIESFSAFLTPEQYLEEVAKEPGITMVQLDELKRRAKDNRKCFVCESFNVWRLANTDMCFTCTTGESDASCDYEIGEPY
jgi:hypothetical protein